MKIQLSDSFDYKRLLRFSLPSIIMMIFTSVYGVVDGFFVSNYAGKMPFAALNLIYPFIMILGTLGFMFGAGGSALIGKTLGEGDVRRANEYFSLFVYFPAACGAAEAVLAFVFLPDVARLLGAEGELLRDCVTYGRILLLALPALNLEFAFSSFCVTAARPNLALGVSVAAGVTNMALDALFVAVFHWGLAGAAAATAASQLAGGLLPLWFFARENDSLLRLGRTRMDGRALLKVCSNGASELMSNISMSLVSMLFNGQLMAYAGADGVAAYGVLMYVNMVFLSTFIGYSNGTAPVVSFHFGAQNHAELKNLLRRGLRIIGAFALVMLALAAALARPLARLFVGYDPALCALTVRAFRIFTLSFPFAGLAIFGSGFFTALNDGLTSAAISFFRTVVCEVAAVLLLPLVWGVDGIWASIVAAEAVAAALVVVFLAAKREKYHY